MQGTSTFTCTLSNSQGYYQVPSLLVDQTPQATSSYANYTQQAKQVAKSIKKKPITRKLKMFGQDDDYEQKKFDEEYEFTQKYNREFYLTRLYKSTLAKFFDISEFLIHLMKFIYDYLFCCKLVCFILRTDSTTQRLRLVERRCLINKAQMAYDLASPSSSSTYSTSITSSSSNNQYDSFNSLFTSNNDTANDFNSSVSSLLSSAQQLKMYDNHPNNLVLDLDETLIHCDEKSLNDDSSMITVQFQETQKNFFLHQRGFLQEFLEQCAQHFNIYIYTASTKSYAEEVVKHIDPRLIIKKIYDRQYCFFDGKQFNKSLKTLGGLDLNRTVMIDNSQACVSNNIDNALKIKDFISDKNDRELQKLTTILYKMSQLTGSFKDFISNYQS